MWAARGGFWFYDPVGTARTFEHQPTRLALLVSDFGAGHDKKCKNSLRPQRLRDSNVYLGSSHVFLASEKIHYVYPNKNDLIFIHAISFIAISLKNSNRTIPALAAVELWLNLGQGRVNKNPWVIFSWYSCNDFFESKAYSTREIENGPEKAQGRNWHNQSVSGEIFSFSQKISKPEMATSQNWHIQFSFIELNAEYLQFRACSVSNTPLEYGPHICPRTW